MRSPVFAILMTFAIASSAVAQEPASLPPTEPGAPATEREFNLREAQELVVSRTRPAMDTQIQRAPTLEEEIALAAQVHMRTCWRMPTDLPDPQRLVVTLQFELNADGTLRARPRVVSPTNYRFDRPMRIAVERAIAAVENCAPFPFASDARFANHHDKWREMEFVFRVG